MIIYRAMKAVLLKAEETWRGMRLLEFSLQAASTSSKIIYFHSTLPTENLKGQRPRRRWEVNIKMELREKLWGCGLDSYGSS
jgi:hypothetical protein